MQSRWRKGLAGDRVSPARSTGKDGSGQQQDPCVRSPETGHPQRREPHAMTNTR